MSADVIVTARHCRHCAHGIMTSLLHAVKWRVCLLAMVNIASHTRLLSPITLHGQAVNTIAVTMSLLPHMAYRHCRDTLLPCWQRRMFTLPYMSLVIVREMFGNWLPAPTSYHAHNVTRQKWHIGVSVVVTPGWGR